MRERETGREGEREEWFPCKEGIVGNRSSIVAVCALGVGRTMVWLECGKMSSANARKRPGLLLARLRGLTLFFRDGELLKGFQ